MAKLDLSIIILNYNTCDLLRACLQSVNRSILGEYRIEVIVVDNASRDGSAPMVAKEFPEVSLIKSSKNLGFAAGNNLAIAQIKGRYVLFLNPDTLIEKETLKVMLDFMEKQSQAALSTCRVELPNGEIDKGCHRGFPTPWNAFCHFSGLEEIFPRNRLFAGYLLDGRLTNRIHQIDACVGAFLLIRREWGDRVGWWDEDYFWYGEDLDFCYRVKQAGGKIFYVPKTKMIHYKGASSGMRKHQNLAPVAKEVRIRAVKASVQAMRIFYQKHYQRKYGRLVLWLVLAGINLLEKIRERRMK
ncbi:MAG: glycosyltransferase family 2 protein [Candidatus Shapirobacteria bacterium]